MRKLDELQATFPNFLRENGVQPLQTLRFPTLVELASEESNPPPPSTAQPLMSLVGGPEVLFSDLLDHPEKYEKGTDELLQLLVSGQLKADSLNAQDLQLLNEAALSFTKPRKKVKVEVHTPPKAHHEEEADLDESGAPLPPDLDLPPEPPLFWWQR
jgi:hypothetical protein